ncbi:MAG: AprI/Inh family metalloprotease inhibitor [Alphaproteobacteria bacterium]
MAIKIVAPIAMALMLAGCGSIGAIGFPVFKRNQAPPPLAPAELPPVEIAALPPPGENGAQQDPFLPSTGNPPATIVATTGDVTSGQQLDSLTQPLPAGTQQQALAQPQATQTIAPASGLGRTDLLGGWTITSNGDSCQLFMTLTSWTGGYRASTRDCSDGTLKSISAWDLKGNQIILSGQGGKAVARLYSTGSSRFDGQTEGQATPVSFYR